MSLRTVLVVEPSKAASRDTDGKQVSSVLPCLASAACRLASQPSKLLIEQ